MTKVVVLGGGTGLSSLLSGLKRHTDDLTAVVTVTDEGGSSGRLRRARGVLPPGDLRNCLVALAEDDALMSRLFQYRFPGAKGGDALEGHAFGNLFLTALADVAGGLDRALSAAGRVLAVRGRVLPVTLNPTRLTALLSDGRRVVGEARVSLSGGRIRRLSLMPSAPPPGPGVLEAIEAADLVVLGPGSLFTSVIPPLLVRGVAQALSRTRALRVYVCNVMTQPGETDRFSAVDHLRALLRHCRPGGGKGPFVDLMLAHDAPPPPAVVRYYARFHSHPVRAPEAAVVDGVRVVRRRLVEDGVRAGGLARHAPVRLAQALIDLL